MLKILKFVLIAGFCLLVLAGLTAFIFLRTFDVEKFRPQIVREISAAIHRDVAIDGLQFDLSLSRGIVMGVRGLRVSDDKDFSSGDFVKVEDILLQVDILSFIRERQIRVLKVSVRSPDVILIKDKNGNLNVMSLTPVQDASAVGASPESSQQASGGKQQSVPPVALLNFVVSGAALEDGRLRYVDKTFDPPLSIEFSRIDLTIDDVAPGKPSGISGRAALWSSRQNMNIKGVMVVDLRAMEVSFRDATAMADLSTISLKKVEESFAALKGAGLKDDLAGDLQVDLQKAVISAQGLKRLSLKGQLSNGSIGFTQLKVPVDRLSASFEMDESNLYINDGSFHLGSGDVAVKGRLEDYLQQRNFRLNLEAHDIDLKEILDQQGLDVRLAGRVLGSLKLSGAGFDGDALLKSVSGDGTLELKEGKISGINILRIVFDKISLIPDLVRRVEENIPQKYKDNIKKNDTDLSKVLVRLSMAEGTVAIPSAQIEADGFGLDAKGRVDLQQNASLQAGLIVLEDLSGNMVKAVGSLQSFVNAQGRIFIPLKEYRGPLSGYRPFPDLEYLAKRFAAQEGRSELEKVLKKVLKTDENGGGSPSPQANPAENPQGTQGSQNPAQQKEKSPEEKMIHNVLDMIFK